MVNETPEQTPERIARYDLVQTNKFYQTDHEMRPDDDGEWVRWEDVTATLAHLTQLVEAYRQDSELLDRFDHDDNMQGNLRARLRQAEQAEATLAHLTQENDRLFDLVRYQRAELLDAGLISTQEYASLLQDGGVNGRGSVARLGTYDALRKRAEQAEATLARVKAQRDELRNALVKVRAHTSYVNPTDELLRGLLQSIERIADAALVDPPVSSSTEQTTKA